MFYHIQYLDSIMLMCAIIFPAGFGANLSLPFQKKMSQSISFSLIGLVASYIIMTLLVVFVKPESILVFNNAPVGMYIIAPFVGLLVLLVEYAIGALQLYFKTGKLITKIVVHSSYSGVSVVKPIDILMIVVFVVGEELILRQTFFMLFLKEFNMSIWLIVLLCTLIFALNHISFGLKNLPQKLASGFIYTLLFYFSGMSIIIPIIAHGVQNLSLLAMSRMGGRE